MNHADPMFLTVLLFLTGLVMGFGYGRRVGREDVLKDLWERLEDER